MNSKSNMENYLNVLENAEKNLDKSNMKKVIEDFHNQITESIPKIVQYPKLEDSSKIDKIVIFGMGGSAISGDLARSYISNNHKEIEIPIFVFRNYNIPSWLDAKTLVIGISYSGNTEETLSGLTQSLQKTKHIIGIASGGELKKLCSENNLPFVEVTGNLQPRAALGYLFFAILNVILTNFCKVCVISKSMIEFQILADFLKEKANVYSKISEDNPALKLAIHLKDKIAIIYSSSDVLDVVNLRWRGQIQENGKSISFGNYLPEMNHNEINSYIHPENSLKEIALIFLTDKNDNPKILERIKATEKLLSKQVAYTEIIESYEDMYLVRIFDLIYLADWVSYYLSILNNEDPTPIPLISELKKIMSDKKS